MRITYTPGQLARLLRLPEPTQEQAAVIGAPLGPLAVIAGAGSGKSETMAARRSRSSRERTRSASSAAAFLVNVRPSTRSGRTFPLATSHTSRAAIVSLLPDPAPAGARRGRRRAAGPPR